MALGGDVVVKIHKDRAAHLMQIRYFETAPEFRAWLAEHHATETELGVVFHSKASGKPTMTWSDAVDQALCFGWIDSIARRLDATSRVQRFTPRKPGSNWSAVNLRKVEALRAQGLMTPAGEAAFARRSPARTAVYSYENRHLAALDPEHEALFRANAAAWEFFSKQPRGYRQTAIYLVMNAKREETRSRRLARLIEDSAAGRRLTQLLEVAHMSITSTDRIEKQVLIHAPAGRVWRALADPRSFGQWFGVNLSGPGKFEPGSRLRGNITHPGYEHVWFDVTVERVEPERLLSWRWHPSATDASVDYSAEPTTVVVFELREVAEGTLLNVVESGFDALPAEWRAEAYRGNDEGWAGQLTAIERYVISEA